MSRVDARHLGRVLRSLQHAKGDGHCCGALADFRRRLWRCALSHRRAPPDAKHCVRIFYSKAYITEGRLLRQLEENFDAWVRRIRAQPVVRDVLWARLPYIGAEDFEGMLASRSITHALCPIAIADCAAWSGLDKDFFLVALARSGRYVRVLLRDERFVEQAAVQLALVA